MGTYNGGYIDNVKVKFTPNPELQGQGLTYPNLRATPFNPTILSGGVDMELNSKDCHALDSISSSN